MKRLLPFLSNLLFALSFSVVLVGLLQPYFASRPEVAANIMVIQLILILTLTAHTALKLISRLIANGRKSSGDTGSQRPLRSRQPSH